MTNHKIKQKKTEKYVEIIYLTKRERKTIWRDDCINLKSSLFDRSKRRKVIRTRIYEEEKREKEKGFFLITHMPKL